MRAARHLHPDPHLALVLSLNCVQLWKGVVSHDLFVRPTLRLFNGPSWDENNKSMV